MKKILLSCLIPLIIATITFGEEYDPIVKPADIICWRSDILEFGKYTLDVEKLESIYGTPLLTHTDIVVDETGKLITSIQGLGTSESTIEERKQQFNMGILIRDESLSELQTEVVIDRAYSMESDYDYGGYYGQVLDYILRLPWMPESRFYTWLFQDANKYYCSEFTALSFDSDISERDPNLTSPLDIYYFALDENTSTNVIYIWSKISIDNTIN